MALFPFNDTSVERFNLTQANEEEEEEEDNGNDNQQFGLPSFKIWTLFNCRIRTRTVLDRPAGNL